MNNNSVILRLATPLTNGQTFEVDVDGVVASNLVKVEKYDGNPTVFADSVAPKVTEVKSQSNTTVRVYFDEPVVAGYQLKLDGATSVTGAATTNSNGKYYADVTVAAGAGSVGNHSVTLYDVTDANANRASVLSATYSISADSQAPSVQSVTPVDGNTFKVKF